KKHNNTFDLLLYPVVKQGSYGWPPEVPCRAAARPRCSIVLCNSAPELCIPRKTIQDDEPPKIACPTGVLLDIPDGVVTGPSPYNIPPVLTCPDNMTMPTLFNRSYGPVSWPNPTATDNIPDLPIAITSGHPTGGAVSLRPDIENPVIYGCPGNLNYTTDLGEPFGRASYDEPTAVDNSGSVRGDRTSKEQHIRDRADRDMESPDVQNCPSDFEVFVMQLSMSSTVTVGWQEPDFTDNSGIEVALSSYPIGLTEVSVYAEDSAGNNATCSYIIEVVDVDPPNITNGCPGDIIINTALGEAVGYPTWTTPEATDNSGQKIALVKALVILRRNA
ncbi:hyalin-like, partial [Strongylocentrotus purpuratus]|uniref:HYR domain-containing protein n=1 Tax=Strongylocentrotus purpuratus TaxID=7668 RepID=A0A7M7NSL7_STRPU